MNFLGSKIFLKLRNSFIIAFFYFHLPHSGHANQNGDTHSLTTIDSNSRNELAGFIEKLPDQTCGYTCLGKGLEQGLNVKKSPWHNI